LFFLIYLLYIEIRREQNLHHHNLHQTFNSSHELSLQSQNKVQVQQNQHLLDTGNINTTIPTVNLILGIIYFIHIIKNIRH
jgi:hypothetical protein